MVTNYNNALQESDNHKYDSSHCFLCGVKLIPSNKTKEHVIPKWLLKQYDLYDQNYILYNGSTIRYRHLTIPCCKKCNSKYLKSLEDKVKEFHDGGFEKFASIDKETLFYWLGKIYYGLIYRDLSLKNKLSDPNSDTIIDKQFIKQFESHHIFLQGIRKRHRFNGFVPWSIFIVNTQQPSDISEQWDLMDNSIVYNNRVDESKITMFISLRMGDIGLVCALQDGGSLEQLKDIFSNFFSIVLHPIQLREFAAMACYKSTLFNRTPKYMSISGNDGMTETTQMPLAGLSTKPLFDNGNPADCAIFLSEYLQLPLDIVNPKEDLLYTFMKTKDGQTNFMDVNKLQP